MSSRISISPGLNRYMSGSSISSWLTANSDCSTSSAEWTPRPLELAPRFLAEATNEGKKDGSDGEDSASDSKDEDEAYLPDYPLPPLNPDHLTFFTDGSVDPDTQRGAYEVVGPQLDDHHREAHS